MNKQLKEQLDRLIKNLEARKRSERLLILGVVFATAVLGYLTFGFDPLRAEIGTLRSQVSAVSSQIAAQQRASAAMLETSQQDPNRFANDRLAVLVREQAVLDEDINNLAGNLVTPDEMTAILTTVLGRFTGLELLTFSNQPAEALREGFTADNVTAEEASLAGDSSLSGQVYAHGLAIEFQGDYFTTLKYLRFLEEISGSFFWDSIRFQQLEWPRAQVSLQIHTLSTDQGFIGV